MTIYIYLFMTEIETIEILIKKVEFIRIIGIYS